MKLIRFLFPWRRKVRREFNSVGCPVLPTDPTPLEIAQYLRDAAEWQRIQPYGRDMDAREWAATVMIDSAEIIELRVKGD